MSIISTFLVVLAWTALAAASVTIVGLAVHALVTVVRNDGYYPRRRPSAPVAAPPRSHPSDTFEPQRWAA